MSKIYNESGSINFRRIYLFSFVLIFSFLAFGLNYKNTIKAGGAISGTVYIDYNMNGIRNTTGIAPNYAVDAGASGVTVTAYDASGAQQGTAVSGADGSYTLNATGTGPYRIEFTNLPSGYFPSAVGADNSSTVRFVPDGNSSNVDFGVISQSEYCQNTPVLATTCFAGTVAGSSADPVLVSFPYESGTTSRTSSAGVDNPTAHDLMVPQSDVGSIWGIAYHRRSNKIFAASFTKRHAGFRNNVQGTPDNDPTGEIFISDPTGTSGSLFINLNTLFGSNIAGDNPHEVTNYDTDTTAFDAVGKTAFGDLELSEDEQTLYAVNLNDRNLYAIPLGSDAPTAPTNSADVSVYDLVTLAGASATCPNSADLRPGALKTYNGKVYYGLTCTAQTSGTSADLRAFVYELDTAGSGSATQVANFALDYPRGCVSNNGTVCADAEWLPWISSQASLLDFVPWDQKYYPQPWLLDIEFDQNNFMIVGLSDRVGHQTGNNRNTGNTGQVEGVSAGDTLRLSPSGATWTLENNASDGANSTGGAGTGDGPGGGEFYFEDGYTITSNVHSEVTLGGLLLVPGYQDIVVSAYDPAPTGSLPNGDNTYRTGGMIWMNNTNGDRTRSYQLFGIDAANTFGKASGIGDLEAMCDAAPLQIGNRIWNDTNGNGIQDSGETPIQNVTVQLWADTDDDGVADTQVGTATTDANGNYIFGGVTNDNMSNDPSCSSSTNGNVNVQVNVSSGDAYQRQNNSVTTTDVRTRIGGAVDATGSRFTNVTIPQGATITSAYIQYYPNNVNNVNNGTPNITIVGDDSDNTPAYADSNNNITNRPDTANSVNWVLTANWANNGPPGPDQRTPDLSAIVQEIVDRPGWASGNAMAFTLTGSGTTSRRDAESFDGTPSDAPRLVVRYTESINCPYEIQPDTAYEVRVPSSNFGGGQPLNGLSPTSANADGSPNGSSRDSDGLILSGNDVVASVTTGISGQNNHTIDFGFVTGTTFSIGNRVWFDTNDNGIIDAGESGISGISVSVLDSGSNVLNTVNTDAYGHYRFDNLPAGDYLVRIDPSNFAAGGVLERYRDTTGNNTANLDSMGAPTNAENGMEPAAASDVLTNGLLSNVVNLSAAAEPTSEPDVPASGSYAGQGTFDDQADMTIDLGFYQMCLSGTLWNDTGAGPDNNNGQLDSGETTIPFIRVRLFDAGGTEIPVGQDGILGTSDDATTFYRADSGGNYNFCGLPAGQYRVAVDEGGSSSTPTSLNPDDNVDSDDNGFAGSGQFAGLTVSNLVTLTPGSSGALGNNTVNNSNATTSNPTVDFGFVVAPTSVKLDGFKVFTNGTEVSVEWQTGEEFNNLGFNVYREVNGERELITKAPIAGSSLRASVNLRATGENYRWTDKRPEAGAVYYLEDIDLNGNATMHGPVYPEMKYFTRREINPLEKLNSPLLTEMTEVDPSAQKEFVGTNIGEVSKKDTNLFSRRADKRIRIQQKVAAREGLKLLVKQDGWYRLTAGELQANGFDVKSNKSLWQLFEAGKEIPLKVSRNGSIEFYGRGMDIPTSDTRVYYLINGQSVGKRINRIKGGFAADHDQAQNFEVTTVRKDRAIYISSIFNGDEENWFGAVVSKNSATEQQLFVTKIDKDEDLTDSAQSNAEARLSIKLQGFTAIEHLVHVEFNGIDLGVVSFMGKENKTFEFGIPRAVVNEGENTLSLQAVGTGNDVSLVDKISLSYPRRFEAVNNKLHFTVPVGLAVEFSGFQRGEKVNLFEIDSNIGQVKKQVRPGTNKSSGGLIYSLAPANYEREMLAVADSSVMQVAQIQKNFPSEWNNRSNKADFVIITTRSLQEYTEELKTVREKQGLKTEVVAIEDLYDEFSFGTHSPEAIRGFLEHATKVWKTKPQYVLLFGDSSFDPRNYLGQTDLDLIPTKLIDTQLNETSSDSWLADFDDDGIEDIALGRLPAANATEAEVMIERTLRYNRQQRNKKRKSTLVSDRGFENYNNLLVSQLPGSIETTRIDRVSMPDSEMREAIINALSADPQVVTYTGHGSTGLWANLNVFSIFDVEQISNERLSLYLLMTCSNGYSHNPYSESFAEMFLKAGDGGAALVWASSGTTYPNTQFEMTEIITGIVFGAGSQRTRIGDAVRQAKFATQDQDVRRTWQLFGDPTSLIK